MEIAENITNYIYLPYCCKTTKESENINYESMSMTK